MHRFKQFILMIVSHLPGRRWHKVFKLTLVDPCDSAKRTTIYTRIVPKSTSSQYYPMKKYKIEFRGGKP